MLQEYKLKENECLISISEKFGHHWETIWNHSENSEIKAIRKDARVMKKGDRLMIPPVAGKQEQVASEKRHKFVRKGIPALVRIQVLREGQPMAGQPWKAVVDSVSKEGTSAGDGIVEIPIGNQAKFARLEVGTGEELTIYELRLGQLDPPDTVSGAQARLNNLGYPCGKVDGILGPNTRTAITGFQKAQGIPASGELNTETADLLLGIHGS